MHFSPFCGAETYRTADPVLMPRKIHSDSDDALLKRFGRNLRRIRRGNGLTQAELAKMLGLSREGYANYERGVREMGVLTEWRIRDRMKTDPWTLEELDDAQGPTDPPTEPGPSVGMWRKAVQWRASLIAARETFDQENFSVVRQRLHNLRDVVVLAAAVALICNETLPDFGPQPMHAGGKINWSLLFSYSTAMVLTPFQVLYIFRFACWGRRRVKA